MAVTGNADLNLRREAGADVVLVARDTTVNTGRTGGGGIFWLPRAVASNMVLSAVAQKASVSVVNFLPIDEGLESGLPSPCWKPAPSRSAGGDRFPSCWDASGRRCGGSHRPGRDLGSRPTSFLVLYGMHRARDFDQDSVDYDGEADLPELLTKIIRDGPEVGVHVVSLVRHHGRYQPTPTHQRTPRSSLEARRKDECR